MRTPTQYRVRRTMLTTSKVVLGFALLALSLLGWIAVLVIYDLGNYVNAIALAFAIFPLFPLAILIKNSGYDRRRR